MKSILPQALENRVQVEGRTFRLRPSTARVLMALDALRDESLAATERYRLFVWLLYRRPRPLGRRLIPAVHAALELLKTEEPYRLHRTQEPLLDLKQDAGLICAAFCQQYGISLPEDGERLDWRVFLALLGGVGEETALGRVIGIRSAKIPVRTAYNAAQILELQRLKAAYAVRKSSDNGRGFEEGLIQMARVLAGLAKEGED